MGNLKTEYMGLKLKNPLIVASSGITSNIENLIKAEKNGAAAVVLKSLFQEQFLEESSRIGAYLDYVQYEEVYDYIRNTVDSMGQEKYFNLIKKAKEEVDIPIIASINCVSTKGWIDYVDHLEKAGADAIELNISFLPTEGEITSEKVEAKYLKILKNVKQNSNIPVGLKIGPYFTAFKNFAEKLSNYGADGLTLFNRFYQFDIDIEKIDLKPGNYLSSSDEISVPLRWVALLSKEIEADISATTGIHNGEDVIKQLLAGAKTVQLCSTLYKNGFSQIKRIKEFVNNWMKNKNFESIEDFRGKLSRTESEYPHEYERMQYIKILTEEKDMN